MSDNKILVVPADLAQKIDDNRGDLTRVEFIEALIDNLVAEKSESKSNGKTDYATKSDLLSFEQDMKQLLKSFLDFFVAYGMEFGDNDHLIEIEKLSNKLQGSRKDPGAENGGKNSTGKATIQWKQ